MEIRLTNVSLHLPVIRRITGGGVIYHADELTYSIVCAPHQLPPTVSIKDSFRILTSFLLGFYRALALDARYADNVCPGQRLGERTAFCFAGKESCDILIGGTKKIGGNAQRRLKNVIFQHGSIPLRDRVGEGVAFLRERPLRITDETISLAETGVRKEEPELKALLLESFRGVMGATLRTGWLSGEEQEAVDALLAKYRDDCWNYRGEMTGRS